MELLILLAITYLVGVDNTHDKYEQAGIKKPPPKPKDKWAPKKTPDTFRNSSYNAAAKTHYGLLRGGFRVHTVELLVPVDSGHGGSSFQCCVDTAVQSRPRHA
ncbi:hypothetical protein, partial [Streptomyces antarcticus]|uniref:hypothetical protein n=1 Tax=Streptomyces antarcticus TaxID=2996458 RepID=UPI0022B051F2